MCLHTFSPPARAKIISGPFIQARRAMTFQYGISCCVVCPHKDINCNLRVLYCEDAGGGAVAGASRNRLMGS